MTPSFRVISEKLKVALDERPFFGVTASVAGPAGVLLTVQKEKTMTRYASGEEPMMGDTFQTAEGFELIADRVVDLGEDGLALRSGAATWLVRVCTLIRRAHTSDNPCGHIREPAKPEGSSLNPVYFGEKPCRSHSPRGAQCQKEHSHDGSCHSNDGKYVEDWSRCGISGSDCALRANHWSSCELIRRAELPEPTDYIFKEGDFAGSGGTELTAEPPAHWLGTDKHGNDVRMGSMLRDIVNGWRGTVIGAHCNETDQRSYQCKRDPRGGRDPEGEFWVMSWSAELVEEKAPAESAVATCGAPYIVKNGGTRVGTSCIYDKGHTGRHGIRDKHAPGGKFEWANPGEQAFVDAEIADGIAEFCRALATPTLAERYGEFRKKVKAALFKFSVFDVEGTTDLLSDGFLLRLRVGATQTAMKFVDEPAWLTVTNFVANAVASEADRIGREALKKR